MKKQLILVGIAVLLISVGLSGCNESNDEETDTPTQYTVIEALAQVINSTGYPIEGESVTFKFQILGEVTESYIRTTDSIGWTSYVIEDGQIPKESNAR